MNSRSRSKQEAMDNRYPLWVDSSERFNLREVAPNLYVGSQWSLECRDWRAVVDLTGSSRSDPTAYGRCDRLLRWTLHDGDPFPEGSLTAIEGFCRDRSGPILLHCAAGLSRSASAAYGILRTHHRLPPREALRRIRVLPQFPVKETLLSVEQWVRRWKYRNSR
jgi:hypothetical protein